LEKWLGHFHASNDQFNQLIIVTVIFLFNGNRKKKIQFYISRIKYNVGVTLRGVSYNKCTNVKYRGSGFHVSIFHLTVSKECDCIAYGVGLFIRNTLPYVNNIQAQVECYVLAISSFNMTCRG